MKYNTLICKNLNKVLKKKRIEIKLMQYKLYPDLLLNRA